MTSTPVTRDEGVQGAARGPTEGAAQEVGLPASMAAFTSEAY